MKSVIYCRVSSKEQEETGYSLPAQEKFLKNYAQMNSLEIDRVFAVSESAGGKIRREIFNQMMDYVKKNKISTIIVETTDRLTRNFADVPIIDNWIMANENSQIFLAKEGCILQKNSKSHEWFMWRVKVATAEYYIRLLSENVKKGQKEKLAQGWLPQKPPIGYKTAGEKGHKTHIIDEEKAPLIKKMFELYATGNHSIKSLTEIMSQGGLRNENGRKVVRSRIHELLADPFYHGKNRWNGKISNGEQKPLISKGLFDEVQIKLDRKIGAPQYKKYLPIFKAKIKCAECGGTITWEIQKGHWYGHCNHYKNCSQKTWVRQEKIEEQLFPYFDEVMPKSKNLLKWLENALKENHVNEIDYNTQQRECLNKIIESSDKRMEKAYRDKLDNKAPVTLCEKIISDSIREKEEAIESLKKLGKSRMIYYRAGYAIHELALNTQRIYQSKKAKPEDKRLLLSMIFSNLGLNEGKIGTNYTKGFEFLANWMPKQKFTFEPAETGKNKNKTDDFSPVSLNFTSELRW